MADALRDQIRDFILENYLFTTDTAALGLDDSLLGAASSIPPACSKSSSSSRSSSA